MGKKYAYNDDEESDICLVEFEWKTGLIMFVYWLLTIPVKIIILINTSLLFEFFVFARGVVENFCIILRNWIYFGHLAVNEKVLLGVVICKITLNVTQWLAFKPSAFLFQVFL
jgi:hypothetical protein